MQKIYTPTIYTKDVVRSTLALGGILDNQAVVSICWISAYIYDDVLLIGEADGEEITCNELAEWAETIPYEILTNINTRVPRIYIRDQ